MKRKITLILSAAAFFIGGILMGIAIDENSDFPLSTKKVIDKIYVSTINYSLFSKEPIKKWKEADVISKDGNMWKIVVDGEEEIMDTETAVWKIKEATND